MARIRNMTVQNLKITVLIENTVRSSKPHLKSKHGLSFFLEAKIDDNNLTMLMDTGPSPAELQNNADTLNIKLEDVDAVILSHGHYDHTGGLIETLKRFKKQIPVIGHPNLFDAKLKVKPQLKIIGSPFKRSEIESLGGVPLMATNPIRIAPGIITTGEIPRITEFESVIDFWTIRSNQFIKDLMLDDQSLVINVEDKGLVILTGCAHSGIINTIRYAQKITGKNRVYAVLGGFHLMNIDDKILQLTVDALKDFDLSFIGPCHCTGKKAIKNINEVYGEQCVPLHTGDSVEF